MTSVTGWGRRPGTSKAPPAPANIAKPPIAPAIIGHSIIRFWPLLSVQDHNVRLSIFTYLERTISDA